MGGVAGGTRRGSVEAGAAQKVSVELEKSVPSHHTRPVLGGPCGAPRTVTPAGASCGTPSLAARRLPVWTLSIPPSPPPHAAVLAAVGPWGAKSSPVTEQCRAVAQRAPAAPTTPGAELSPGRSPGIAAVRPRGSLCGWQRGRWEGLSTPDPFAPPTRSSFPSPGDFNRGRKRCRCKIEISKIRDIKRDRAVQERSAAPTQLVLRFLPQCHRRSRAQWLWEKSRTSPLPSG